MCVLIIGGHDCMTGQYKQICKKYKCNSKIYTHMPTDMKRKFGSPDLVVLFTGTVSHKLVRCVVDEAKKKNASLIRSHSSSGRALQTILEQFQK